MESKGCTDHGFKVTFQTKPKNKGHDYDFIVDGYPAQMKSLNVSLHFNEAVNSKQTRFRSLKDELITADLVHVKIIDSISSMSNFDEIDDARNKGAKVIFLNATTDESGSYFSQYCLDRANSFPIKKSLDIAINLVKNSIDFVPLVFGAISFRLGYYINTLVFKIPITVINDEKKVDRNKQVELLQPLETG